MEAISTPESRFDNLKDYPFAAHYVEVGGGLRMHYVDEGINGVNANGGVILMLHGEPSWSYLYRHMIRHCVAAGYRVIAPDLIGFGKSDKPTQVKDYSFQSHMDWITAFIEKLDLNNITLFGQDWGSLIGLRLAAEQQQRFSRMVIGNGMLPTGEVSQFKGSNKVAPLAFLTWRSFAVFSPWLPIARIINFACQKKLTSDEIRAYDAPFPSKKYKAGARAFPKLVPITPNDPATEANKAAWKTLEKWDKPFLTCFSTGDPITGGFDKVLQRRIPGAEAQSHIRVQGGHFLQEDSPLELSQAIIELIETTQ
ncbi:MAG: haloalkane dehalogenase [Moraxellaceae bacterium]|nr:MAG: haloalkane dehalogenase [Moraxellaceae bacterium]